MEKLLKELVEKAKCDQSLLRQLKSFATKNCQYQFAKELRDMELEFFPETAEIKKDKDDAKCLSHCLQMCDLNVDEKTAYVIMKCMEVWKKKKGNFAIDDSSKITFTAQQLFY